MCGIAGVISKDLDYAKQTTKVMTHTLIHRGPDDFGFWDNGRDVSFGHRRLAIQDVSAAGHQPMSSSSRRYTLVFNGEIYNFLALRLDLKKHFKFSFQSSSDTEVILALLDTYGIDKTVTMLEGMFVIAIYDNDEKSVYLIRDRVGEKPLYYSYTKNELCFASELKSFKKSKCVDLTIDPESVSLYLSYTYIPHPRTIYKHVKKLEPATILKLDIKRECITQESYWRPSSNYINHSLDFSESKAQLNSLIINSVSNQKISDVDLGCFLSGGIDSSLITAVSQSLSDKPIDTFTIGFENKAFNEAEHAKSISKYLGTSHHEHIITERQALDVIPNLMNIYDEPFSDSSAIPTLLLTQNTRKNMTVALSGDGGDELFNGYTRHQLSYRRYNLFKRIPFKPTLGKLFGADLTQRYYCKNDYLKRNNLEALSIYFNNPDFETFYALISAHLKMNGKALNRDFHVRNLTKSSGDLYRDMSLIDISSCLVGDMLVKLDRASMYSSLETRVPLLDYKIIEFALTLPSSFKINNGKGKHILREVLYQYIPQNLIDRPKKGFSAPLFNWLQTVLKDPVLSTIESTRDQLEQLIKKEWIDAVIIGFYKDKKKYHYYLWDIYILAQWLEAN